MEYCSAAHFLSFIFGLLVFEKVVHHFCLQTTSCSTSPSRRKPGWRFTAGLTWFVGQKFSLENHIAPRDSGEALWLVQQRFPCLKSNTKPRSIGSARHPRTSVNFVIAFVFLIKFYIRVSSFVRLTLKISYWSLIFCDYQLPSSFKP